MTQPSRRRRRASSPARRPSLAGPHELGQNWLVDRRIAAEIAEILRHAPPHPILELAAGNGAITEALVARHLPVTAVEIDPLCATRLKQRFAGRAEIIEADMLDFDIGLEPHHVVANVPFSLTTPLLRRLVQQETWDTAVLLLQWEVARKRAGVGGTTMLTANWWPWYEFSLVKRVPAAAFAPHPSVDGGVLLIRRRQAPLVSTADRKTYQELVRVVFTGRGRGIRAILRRFLPERAVRDWMVRQSLDQKSLPRDLKAEQWASLHRLSQRSSARPSPTPEPSPDMTQRAGLLVRLLAGRWTLAVLTELIDGGRSSDDVHDALDGIVHNVLTETLRRAERDGLVTHHLDHDPINGASLYELTDLGRALREPLAALDRWAEANWGHVETARRQWDRRAGRP